MKLHAQLPKMLFAAALAILALACGVSPTGPAVSPHGPLGAFPGLGTAGQVPLMNAGGTASIWAPLLQPVGLTTIMALGDSKTIASDVDTSQQAGSWRPAFEARLRGQRTDWEFIGTQVTGTTGTGGLHNFFHEGHGGFTIANINSNFATYVASVGCPSIGVLEVGTNDVTSLRTAVQMEADFTTLAGTVASSCPNTRWVLCGPMPFSAGSTTGGNLVAYNTIISAVSSWVDSTFIPAQVALGRVWVHLDLSWVGLGEHQSDGVHPHATGAAEWGLRLADLMVRDVRLLGPLVGMHAKTRLYRVQPPTAVADWATAATDTATAADPGASPAAGSFAACFDWYPKNLPTGSATALASYGTQGTATFWAVTQQGTQLLLWWGNATNPVVGPAGAWPGTYPGGLLLSQANALIVNTWNRTCFGADAVSGNIALYNNGALLGVSTGNAAWNMATNQTLTLRGPSASAANGSFAARFWCFKPATMTAAYPNAAASAAPGTYAFAELVERDLYYGAPLFPGSFSIRDDMNLSTPGTAGQFLVGGIALTWNGATTLGSAFGNLGGPGFVAKPRAWEWGGPGLGGAAGDPGW